MTAILTAEQLGTNVRTRRSLFGGVAGFAACASLAGPLRAFARPHHHAHPAHAKAASVAAGADAVPSVPANTPIGPFDTVARWAYVVDYTTGAVLLDKASDERMAPSSLTKMMTAYIVFGMLATGRIRLDQSLPVSEKAWRTQGSKMFVPLGESVLVSDLIQGMVIQSGNDACVVLAEGIAGSEERFVAMMNEEAPKIGLTNSHFMNVTGLPAEGHYMSAHDVGTVALHLIRDFPQYYHFFGETEFTFNRIKQGNRNVLVDKGLADGLKTGHTDAGGFGLCASSNRNGNRVIVVINGTSSSNERAHEGERLMAWAFANFENATLFRRGQVVDHAPVWMGEHKDVPLVAGSDIVMTLPIGWQQRSHIGVDYSSPVIAPVREGQVCGALVISAAGMPDIRVPLQAGRSVGQLGLIGRAMARLGHGPA
ncbi:D-alanyl-D-alanine carboxypeptidase family protein [Gluconobacter morbifer]|uniref:serine-type D-Ala-D-Ala carboxypeptidase n=1 Tax=Gluconobacter morbifer G707 TaxID=1088869 RepID=G6XI63_9PROT|nr:D-alanyl-D-alanine carboxypeptidase family protein [Gluconobacter morbifer]EHH68503.1 D-alanyl-D-alanine carboxypeptidase [Gluconobacter morbifer G707]